MALARASSALSLYLMDRAHLGHLRRLARSRVALKTPRCGPVCKTVIAIGAGLLGAKLLKKR